MKPSKRTTLAVETLDERVMPALSIWSDPYGNLNIYGTPSTANGDVTIRVDTGFVYRIFDAGTQVGGPLATFTAPGNLNVTLVSAGDDSITLDLDTLGGNVGGNVNVDTGAGNDTFAIDGGGQMIGGNVFARNVNTFSADDVAINGSLTQYAATEHFDGGLTLQSFSSVGGSVNYQAGNGFETVNILQSTVGTDAIFSLGNGGSGLTLSAGSVISRSLRVTSGSGLDDVNLNGTVGTSASINLGTGENSLDVGGTGVIGTSLSYTGGLGGDAVDIFGEIGGSATFNMGDGDNDLIFRAGSVVGGTSIYYRGGLGTDSIRFNADASQATLTAFLFGGDDTVRLNAQASLSYLYVDFGTGTDTYIQDPAAQIARGYRLINL